MSNLEKQLRKEFGVYLRMQRLRTGRSQKEIATLCGYSSPQFISNIERGLCAAPPEVLVKMSKEYKINRKTLARAYNKINLRLLERSMGIKHSS